LVLWAISPEGEILRGLMGSTVGSPPFPGFMGSTVGSFPFPGLIGSTGGSIPPGLTGFGLGV